MSLGAAGDGAHVYIEHVVEVDPLQVDEGPAREGERGLHLGEYISYVDETQ